MLSTMLEEYAVCDRKKQHHHMISKLEIRQRGIKLNPCQNLLFQSIIHQTLHRHKCEERIAFHILSLLQEDFGENIACTFAPKQD